MWMLGAIVYQFKVNFVYQNVIRIVGGGGALRNVALHYNRFVFHN